MVINATLGIETVSFENLKKRVEEILEEIPVLALPKLNELIATELNFQMYPDLILHLLDTLSTRAILIEGDAAITINIGDNRFVKSKELHGGFSMITQDGTLAKPMSQDLFIKTIQDALLVGESVTIKLNEG